MQQNLTIQPKHAPFGITPPTLTNTSCQDDTAPGVDEDTSLSRAMRQRPTVLVVDDDAAVREVVAEMLDIFDINVLSAAGGLEGIQLFQAQQENIDVILLDIRMPDLDGIQTYKILRQIDSDISVIFSSGYTENDEAQRLIQSPSTLFLPKPYDLTTLIRTMEKITGVLLM